MRILGEISLLSAFIASGYACGACLLGDAAQTPRVRRTGLLAIGLAALGVTACLIILALALAQRDFTFDYVAHYSSQALSLNFALAALWVGQAGSLLLWAWLTVVMITVFRFVRRTSATALEDKAAGLAMGFVACLLGILVFAADPMQASPMPVTEGQGLSPSLQHPAMMIHPPIVFCGYAAWTIPCALALGALVSGQLDLRWIQAARPWAIFAWVVLGTGILIGAYWAYEELGWGGYWGWDPVENGSLIPWLTGTCLIHAMLVWRAKDGLKKSALGLAVATFGLCNFATFLTRSGIFSSLHAFSESPIGWTFLAIMIGLTAAGCTLIYRRRGLLPSGMRWESFWSREALIVVATVALLLLATIVFVGTAILPLSLVATGHLIVVGPGFYNSVLAPIGLVLLAATAPVPLLRWGLPPSARQKRALALSGSCGVLAALVAIVLGVRQPLALLLITFAATAPVALLLSALNDTRRAAGNIAQRAWHTLQTRRRAYAAYTIHIGFVLIAVGIAGSSLGTAQQELELQPGVPVTWQGRSVEFVQLAQRELPDKIVAAAELRFREADGTTYALSPERHYHKLQRQWTTEVDIHSAWSADVYTILNGAAGEQGVSLTLIENPLMRWLWLGGFVCVIGALITLWPERTRNSRVQSLPVPQTASVPETPSARRRAA